MLTYQKIVPLSLPSPHSTHRTAALTSLKDSGRSANQVIRATLQAETNRLAEITTPTRTRKFRDVMT